MSKRIGGDEMKGFTLKKVIISISTFLFATCLGLGAGFMKTPVNAETLTDKNNFSALDTSLTTATSGFTIGNVDNTCLVVNHAIGGGKGSNVQIEADVTFSSNMLGAIIGFVPTNNKADIAAANKSGNGYANSDYLVYWFNPNVGSYVYTGFTDNAFCGREDAVSIQKGIIGNVKLRVTIETYGDYTVYLYVPSTNTQMDASVARNTWHTLVDVNDCKAFLKYDTAERGGSNATGYPYFSMNNVTYNSISITPGADSSIAPFSDNFLYNSDTFSSKYVTNDAFDNAVIAGTITLPQADVVTTRRGNLDMIRTNESFKGAMRVELDMNAVGPTALLGFYSLNYRANAFVQVDLRGALVQGFDGIKWNQMGDVQNWTAILGEDMSKFSSWSTSQIACMGGDFTLILDINEQGDATFSLWVRSLTPGLGSGLKTDEPYVLTTVPGLYADVVTGGGYLVFGATDSIWEHHTTLKGIRFMDGNGEMLIEDDFSCNNFNGEGANYWLVSEAAQLYTLPGVNAVTFSGSTAYVNAQNTATAKEKLTLTWNARVDSGEMKYYLGMDSKDTSTATAYLTVANGNLTFTQDTTITLASGIDFAKKTQVKLEFNNAEKRVYAYVNGEQKNVVALNADITGYMGIYATNARLTYLKAEINDAFTVIDTQNGAYLKANTTLENSGIRFASIIDKAWYDATVADETVEAVTYGTLIVPTDYLLQVQHFTLAGLEESGLKYINAVVDNGFVNQATAEEDGYYQFMGGIKNILPANYTRNFSAVGYVTVTYKNAETKTYYGGYNETDHSRSIYQLADRVYADRQTEAVDQYTYLLNDGTYAKYEQAVMDVMQIYLDSVVNITLDSNGLNYVEVNDYYTRAYTATLSGNTVSVVSSKPISTIIINGIRQKNFTCVQDGDTYTATVTYAGIFDQQALFAVQTQVTEVPLAGLSAYPNIKAYTYKSVAYNSRTETQPFMAVGMPDKSIPMPEGGYPAMVVVHGGGGNTFVDWIKYWTDKGFVAIAPDMFGNMLNDSLAKVANPNAGPDETHAGSQIDDPYDYKNSWVYHSVTNVVLCHNYLRSLPNVNADKIGITGISWGAFITNIVSGVDNRFKAIAPVYGAGYIYDDSVWPGPCGGNNRQQWIYSYDPSSYVIFNTKPTLYVSGIDDNCFSITNRVKTYALAQGDVYFSQRSDLAHGHYWDRTQEVYHFMDKMLNGTQDSVTGFLDLTFNFSGTVPYVKVNNYAAVKDKIAYVNLLYTNSTDADSHKWTYATLPITLNEEGAAAIDITQWIPNAKAFTYEFVMVESEYRWSTEVVILGV